MCVSLLDNIYTIVCKQRWKRKNCSRGKQVRSVHEVARCTTVHIKYNIPFLATLWFWSCSGN